VQYIFAKASFWRDPKLMFVLQEAQETALPEDDEDLWGRPPPLVSPPPYPPLASPAFFLSATAFECTLFYDQPDPTSLPIIFGLAFKKLKITQWINDLNYFVVFNFMVMKNLR